MRGAFISAKSLDAFFESLILESLQDIVESKSWSANLGLSLESVKNLKGVNGYSIGGSDARHSKHVVERLSGLLGEEEARVVVAGALHLNGAMIAAAQRDENGKYNDHGNLVLKVGELFWQHIYDYDNGHTLGMSYSKSFGKKAESEGQAEGKDVWHLGGVVGGHDKEGVTKATIGLGDVTIGESKEVPEGINRYVNFVQEMQTNYDVQPIKPHFTNQDIQTLIDGLKRKEDGSFDLGATISSISERAYETVAVPLSEAADYLFPEKKQQLNDEDYGTRLVKAPSPAQPIAEEDQGSKDEDYDDGIDGSSEFKMRAEFYINARLREYLEAGKLPDWIDIIKGVVGLEIDLLGSVLGDLRDKYPEVSGGVDKVLELANVPAVWVFGQVKKGYAAANEKVINLVKEEMGVDVAKKLEYTISKKEQDLARALAKFAPTENQQHVLDALELIGLGKVAKEVFKVSAKVLNHYIDSAARKFAKPDVDYSVTRRADIHDSEIKTYISAEKLKNDLHLEEMSMMFDKDGILKSEFVIKSKEIPLKGGITNPKVIKVLTSDGSQIMDWGKFTTTDVIRTSYGQRMEFHYYMNKKNGKIITDIDYKFK